MSLLRTIELRISRIVEGTFGKVFRTGVQPVELARRLVKEMDEHQQRTVRNVYVPNIFDVYLSRDDHRNLSPCAAALTTELSEYLAEHARRNSYMLLTRPQIKLHLDRDLTLGRFGIAVSMKQSDALDELETSDNEPIDTDIEAVDQTMVHQSEINIPENSSGTAASESYAVFGPDGPYLLAQNRVHVGRGRSNDLVLHDPSVSRNHAELIPPSGNLGWLVRDLGSTNGVTVNGSKVQEKQLALGDIILFGNCSVRFDHWAGGED